MDQHSSIAWRGPPFIRCFGWTSLHPVIIQLLDTAETWTNVSHVCLGDSSANSTSIWLVQLSKPFSGLECSGWGVFSDGDGSWVLFPLQHSDFYTVSLYFDKSKLVCLLNGDSRGGKQIFFFYWLQFLVVSDQRTWTLTWLMNWKRTRDLFPTIDEALHISSGSGQCLWYFLVITFCR